MPKSRREILSDSRSYATFTRCSPKIHLQGVIPAIPQLPLLVLTEPTEQGTWGFPYRGFILYTDEQGQRRYVGVHIVILGITLIIGLFHDIDDDLYVLVVTDVGLSLSEVAPSKIYSTRQDLSSFWLMHLFMFYPVTSLRILCLQSINMDRFMVICVLPASHKTPLAIFQSSTSIKQNISHSPIQSEWLKKHRCIASPLELTTDDSG